MSNPEHEQIIRRGYAVAEAMDVPGFVNTFTPDGTFTDEAFGNVFTGPKELAIMLQVLCCDVFRIVDGRIKTFNCYWSAATVLAQLGVLGNLEGAVKKAD